MGEPAGPEPPGETGMLAATAPAPPAAPPRTVWEALKFHRLHLGFAALLRQVWSALGSSSSSSHETPASRRHAA